MPNSCQLFPNRPCCLASTPIRNWGLAFSLFALILTSGCVTAPEERLRQAAAEGNLLRVETFVSQGVNAQATDARGITPLHLAAKNGHRNVVALLLERGAAVNPESQDGLTPLSIAVQEGQRELVALLLETGAQVKAQVQIGGVTLLHVAAYRGDQEIVSLLLRHGADKHARMTSGERAVDLAQQQGHQTLIPLLEP
ncbi:MAG: ankyrin repeat domain-containing protein [Nitrospira sp.]